MSERNKQLDRHFYESVWNEGNFDLVDELVASDYIGHELPDETVAGPEDVKRNVATLRRAFPDLHFTIEDQVAEGDRVVTRWTARGTHERPFEGISTTGKPVVFKGINIARIADGRYVEEWIAFDHLSLLQQLGAIPAQDPV